MDLSRFILTHYSLKTFVEGIIVTGTLTVSNKVASVLDYSSNTQGSSKGDFCNTDEVCCRYGIGRVVTSVFRKSPLELLSVLLD